MSAESAVFFKSEHADALRGLVREGPGYCE